MHDQLHDQHWHRLIPPAAGFIGAVVMLSYIGEMPISHWVAAIGSAVLTAYFAPPIAVAWMIHNGLTWLPTDGSVQGLIGLVSGLAAIHLVGAVNVLGRRFAKNPTDFTFGDKSK